MQAALELVTHQKFLAAIETRLTFWPPLVHPLQISVSVTGQSPFQRGGRNLGRPLVPREAERHGNGHCRLHAFQNHWIGGEPIRTKTLWKSDGHTRPVSLSPVATGTPGAIQGVNHAVGRQCLHAQAQHAAPGKPRERLAKTNAVYQGHVTGHRRKSRPTSHLLTIA